MTRNWTRAVLAALLATTCAGVACSPKAPEPQAAAKAKAAVGTGGFDLTGIDKNVKPGDDTLYLPPEQRVRIW